MTLLDTDGPTRAEIERYLAVALAIADETRAIVRAALDRGFAHRRKADRTFVTDVDLAVEDRVRERLAAAFPDHAVIGEERAERASASELTWLVDPIDGTLSLLHGVPLYGTILGLRHRGLPVVGVIDLPGLDRRYHAAAGSGAFRNGLRLRLAEPEDVADEIVAIGDRRQFEVVGRLDVFERILAAHPVVRTYTDCFGHALAIEGAVGAMVDFGLRAWDLAATEILITEAGGRYVETRRGDTFDVVFGKPAVVEKLGSGLRSLDRLDLDGVLALELAADLDLVADVLERELLVGQLVQLAVAEQDELSAALGAVLGAARAVGVRVLGSAPLVGDPPGEIDVLALVPGESRECDGERQHQHHGHESLHGIPS